MADHPFRFYGAFPDDWYEQEIHEVTVCFDDEPTGSQKVILGRTYARFATDGTSRIQERWSGRFLELCVAAGRGGRASHLGPVTKFLRAAHDVVPIIDVVYHQAREASDAWSSWSEQQGPPVPRPTPEQAWPGQTHAEGSRPYTPSAEFDAGYASWAHAYEAAGVRRRLEDAGAKFTLRERPPTDYPGPRWSDADFEGFELADGPVLRDEAGGDNVGRYRWRRTRAGDYPMSRESVVRVAFARDPDGAERLAWLDEAGGRRVSKETLPPEAVDICVHPDGAVAMVVGKALALVDLESRRIRLVEGNPEHRMVRGHFLAGEDRVLVQTQGPTFRALDVSGTAAREVATLKAKADDSLVAVRGRVVVLQLASGLAAHAFNDDRFIRLGTLRKIKVPFVGHRSGREVFGWPGHPFELDAEELLEEKGGR